MNIKKFKNDSNLNKNQYVVIIISYNKNGHENDRSYVLCKDLADARRFLYWKYKTLQSDIIEKYVTNSEITKYNGESYKENDFTFSINYEHEFAFILNATRGTNMYCINLEPISNTSVFYSIGYDGSIETENTEKIIKQ